jgi:Flp pilus assembly pilin Flp
MVRTTTSQTLAELLGGLASRLRREEGQTLAEYALLLTLCIVGLAAVILLLGNQIVSMFSSVIGQF